MVIIVTAPILTYLLTGIGMSDSMIGVVSSLISMTVLFQLVSVWIVRKITNTKLFSILFHCIGRLFFGLMYFVPLLPLSSRVKQILVVVCIILGYFGYNFVSSLIFRWGNSFVDPRRRARFSSTKEKISLVTGMVVTFGAGYIMDRFEAADNMLGGFLFVAIAVLVFSICDLVCLLLIDRERRESLPEKKETIPMKDIITNTLKNRSYLRVVLLFVLYTVSNSMLTGFLGTYQLKELGFSLGVLQIISIGGSFVRFFASKSFGKYSDKTSYVSGSRLGMIFTALGFLVCIFTTRETRWLVVVYVALSSLGMAGLNQNSMNVVYGCVEEKYFAEASAIKNCICGICGFGTSLIASLVLEYIQRNGNKLFGISIYAQQALAIPAMLLMLSAAIYAYFVIEKRQKKGEKG